MVTIDRALSRRFRRLSQQIIAAQDKLRSSVSPRAWRTYRDLEQVVGAREDAVLGAVVRLAFRRGQHMLLAVVRHPGVD
jgi:hypothetical protein